MQKPLNTAKACWLHIPMEIVDRELYPKLLLASEAIAQGWQCTIGSKKAIFQAAGELPPGIVYLKSVIPSELGNIKLMKRHGHRLVCMDEEGLVQSSLETLVTARYCNETVAETEKLFCWGDIQRKALQDHYKQHADKFVTTGSPTADLWTMKAGDIYTERVAELHSRFGKYIIIPSSFGVPNHFMGPEEALGIMVRDNMFRDQADYDYYKRYHDYTEKVFHKFLKMLPVVAKEFKDHTIILRPHPSENHETWKRAAAGLDNVVVIFEGPVSPWLFGAEAILHWGSTTGIEGFLMGRPVIGYCPYPEEEKAFDVLPHLVSILTETPADVVKVIHDVLKNKDWLSHYPDVIEGHRKLKEWIYNIDHAPAIKTLMNTLDAMNPVPQSFHKQIKTGVQALTFKEFVWRCIEAIAKIPGAEKFLPARLQLGFKSRAFGRQKTKNMDEKEIRVALAQLGSVPFSVRMLAHNLYCVCGK